MPATSLWFALVSLHVAFPYCGFSHGFVARNGFIRLKRTKFHDSTTLASALVSALECETPRDVDSNGEFGSLLIEWLDPLQLAVDASDTPTSSSSDSAAATTLTVPLYPLSSIAYLPDATSNCTLCNTEPRNIQMALDLQSKMSMSNSNNSGNSSLEGPLFCAVLRAVDTGRIARVGTLLRVLELQIESSTSTSSRNPQNIQRIRLTCVPQGSTVDILGLHNPLASTMEYRLQHPTEYLQALVRPHEKELGQQPLHERHGMNDDASLSDVVAALEDDYTAVRSLYLNGDESDAIVVPRFARQKIADALLPISSFDLTTSVDVWRFATLWQTLCETVREGHLQALMADRNELLIDSAIRKGGGPLQLPVHVEDVLPLDRRRVQVLEQEAQATWRRTQLDPCLDFQVLLELPSQSDRLQYLGNMVARERQRLSTERAREKRGGKVESTLLSKLERPSFGSGETEPIPVDNRPRKGAWFNDDAW